MYVYINTIFIKAAKCVCPVGLSLPIFLAAPKITAEQRLSVAMGASPWLKASLVPVRSEGPALELEHHEGGGVGPSDLTGVWDYSQPWACAHGY